MVTLQHCSCVIHPSHISSVFNQPLKQRNPLLPQQQQLLLQYPRKPKAFTFRVSSLGAGLNDIAQIAHNKVLIAACGSVLIGQLLKPFTSVFLYGKEFDIKALIQAGGFPSSHSSATVASATLLGLERGFSDPIFGLTVVYAGLIMYDAQGVRREVGIHARTMNKLLLHIRVNSLLTKDKEECVINSKPRLSTPLNVEGLENSLLSQEASSLDPKQNNAGLLIKPGSKINQTDKVVQSSGFSEDDAEEISRLIVNDLLPLKESIGHTEVEVISGALLGILVGLAVYNFM